MSIYNNETIEHKSALICQGMTLTGNIESDCDIVLEGIVNGNITCHDLVVRETSKVVGDITANSLSLYTSLNGNVTCAKSLAVYSGAELNGDVKADSLICEGVINGNIVCDSLLQLKNGSVVKGDVCSERFFIDETVTINGMITTKPKAVVPTVEVEEATTEETESFLG